MQQQQQQQPVLDSRGLPAEGIVYSEDADGVRVRCRLWRGFYVTDFEGTEGRLDRLRSDFQPRPDDLLICGYLKCGTHWLHDICHFLLTRQCQERSPNKENFMLEFKDHETMERFPSPRVLNCHLPLCLIPERILRGPNKIVCVVRNPKDVAVSLYHHYTSIADYNYKGSFPGFLAGLFETGRLDGGSYFEHTRDFLRALGSELLPGNKVHLVEYEKLKADTRAEIRRLDAFLRASSSSSSDADAEADDADDAAELEQLLDGICERVGFEQMRRERGADMGHLFSGSGASGGFYRKGDVGDWRNWFDEAASARIDALTERYLADFSHLYTPTYENEN